MISIDFSLILVILNFVLLMIILNKLLFKNLKKFLTERQSQIEADLENARLNSEKAEALVGEQEDLLKKTNQETRRLKEAAKKNAEITAEKILEEARVQERKVLADAEVQLEHERKKVLKELESELTVLVSGLSAKIITEKIDPKKDEALINGLIGSKK